jgi:hypothetical protein
MGEAMKSTTTAIRLLLAATFVFGLLLIIGVHCFQIQWDGGVIHEIGSAFMVAAILGGQ